MRGHGSTLYARISSNHAAGHDRQPFGAAVVQERQLLVVEAQQVQDRGVDVVDVGLFSMAYRPISSVAP